MKENNLDKCIRANFKMVENDIAAASCMPILMIMCLITLFLSFLAIIPLIASCVYIFKMYKKLFFTSVYGESAATYQSLPANAAEMTAAKIFVAGVGEIICVVAYVVVFGILFMTLGRDGLGGVINAIERLTMVVDMSTIAYVLPLGILSLFVGFFAQSALIYLAVAAYNSVVREQKKGLYRFLIVIAAYGVNLLLGNSGGLLEKLGIESLVIPSVVGIALGFVVMVLCYRRTVRLMEERYDWN